MQRTPRDPHTPSGGERGIALVAAVLMLLLTAVLAGTFMASTTSERAISGNVHVARAALVAADAGVRVAQQRLANVGFAKLDSSKTAWNGSDTLVVRNFYLNGYANPNNSVTVTSTNPRFTATASIAFVDTTVTANRTEQFYDYSYTINSTGSAGTYGQRMVQSKGILRLSVERGSFTDYLMFTNVHTTSGGAAVWFSSGTNFDGRVHTNGQFRFAFQPTFQDRVSCVNTQAWFYNNNNPIQRNANNNGTIDQPIFAGGFYRNQANVPLPTNTYSQQGAALGYGGSVGALTNTQIRSALGLTGTTAPPNDIYVVNNGGAKVGGFYVQGTLDSCVMFVSGGNQVYRLRQGTTQVMITIDRSVSPNVTTWTRKVGAAAATSGSYTGIPTTDNVIYVTGGISNLVGPDRVSGTAPGALAANNQLMVCAVSDIVVQRDVTYANYDANNTVLGLYSQSGSVRIGSNMPNDGRLDAYVMATGSTASFMVDNCESGSPRGTFHLRGGMVTTYYGGFGTMNSNGTHKSGYLRDFHYDGRGLKPPYFPTTTTFNTNDPVARTLSWKEM
jgi:Tfp pilus assembly protein PilX